jgi:hypothetical protein
MSNSTKPVSKIMLQDNYDYMMQSPMVRQLRGKIADLKQENKILMRILKNVLRSKNDGNDEIDDLPQFSERDALSVETTATNISDIKLVEIKLEPTTEVRSVSKTVIDLTCNQDDGLSEVELSDKPNILYELIEPEQEAEEAEEQEEEQEE